MVSQNGIENLLHHAGINHKIEIKQINFYIGETHLEYKNYKQQPIENYDFTPTRTQQQMLLLIGKIMFLRCI